MKRRWALCAVAAMLCGAAASASAGEIYLGLSEALKVMDGDEVVSTLVFLQEQVDPDTLKAALDAERAPRQLRNEISVRSLQDMAEATQGSLLKQLKLWQMAGKVESFEPFWISNVIRVDATKNTILELAEHPDVLRIYENYEIELIDPVYEGPVGPGGSDAPEIGLVAIKAPEVWALGYTGEGVLVSNMDTGVDGNHPAFKDRWAGVADPRFAGHPEWAWYDPYNNQNTFPYDGNGHGTHTMGTVTGGPPGDQIGVAPGAFWQASAPIDRGGGIPRTVADALLSFEWMLDPDHNPSTSWDVPHVCSNSWGLTTSHGYPPCDELFWDHLDACEAAGTLIIFSAGNEGSSGLRRPSDRATDDYRTMAVAAIDANNPSWPIASFSSRGPTYCTPNQTAAIKPDIAAPGVDVRSAAIGGGYRSLSGTSMASPHINGVVALMIEACDQLLIEEYKQIIYETAYDLGTPGEDNSYGWGNVDALAAVQMALDMCGPHPPRANDVVFESSLNRQVMVTLSARDDGLPDPPGKMTFIIVELPANGALVDPNAGLVTEVPYSLANNGNEVWYYPAVYYSGTDLFRWKANDGGQPPEGGDSEIVKASGTIGGHQLTHYWPLDTDPGWQKEGAWAYGQPTGQGGDHGGPDPTAGHTGPNVYGYNLNGDYVNNMPEYDLTMGPFDCSNLSGVKLGYWRWLGVERSLYDHAYIRISTDGGANWVNAWANPDEELAEDEWTYVEVDVSTWADRKPQVWLRWTMGTTDIGWTYCGWNIDDIGILGLVDYAGDFASPEKWTMFRGSIRTGGMMDSYYSDDQRLVLESGFTVNPQEPEVWAEIDATSPQANPDELRFVLEGGAITAGQYTQKIELWNYSTNGFEQVDARPTSFGDTKVEVVISSNPARFIQAGTAAMKARLTWKATGFSAAYPWMIGVDQVLWNAVSNGDGLAGDVNCDGLVNMGDVQPFVNLLSQEAVWRASNYGCDSRNGDVNRDGKINFADVSPFVSLITGR